MSCRLPGRTAALILAPTLAVLVGLASGCGGSATMSRSAYRAELKRVSRRLSEAGLAGWPRYRGLLVANPPPGIAQESSAAEIAADTKSARELASLKPPADAAADNAKLVTGLRALAGETAGSGFSAAQLKSPAGIARLAQKTEALQDRLQQKGTAASVQDYETARDDLERKGYWPEERRYAIVVSGPLGPTAKSPCAAGPQVIPPFVEGDSEQTAVTHLERSGFRVVVTRRPSAKVTAGDIVGESPTAICVRAVVHLAVSTGPHGVRPVMRPKEPTPLPFDLVSRAGTQAAERLSATACTTKAGVNCSFSTGSENVLDFRPHSLSVVRPGEQVRFALPKTAYPVPEVAGTRFPSTLLVYKRCNPVLPAATKFLHRPQWTVELRPGEYTVFFAFVSREQDRLADEGGAFGLAVSRTQDLQIVRATACS